MENEEENKKVFISYSQDSEEHINWVTSLANRLVENGVEIIYDQWDLRIGDDLLSYMEQGLSKSKLILCICSENYVKKSNELKGGVGYEKNIISAKLFRELNQSFIIPIIRNNDSEYKVPTFLSSRVYIDFLNDSNFEQEYSKLIARIYDQDKKLRPEIGKNPYFNSMADEILSNNSILKSKYNNADIAGKVEKFNYTNNNGEYNIGLGEYSFITKWSGCSQKSIYAYSDYAKKIGYKENFNRYPEYDDLKEFDYSSRVREICIGEVVIYLNNYKNFAVIKVTNVEEAKNEVSFEYQIYKK